MADVGYNATSREQDAQLGDYFALLKPRVMSLVVFTALVGLLAAPVSVHPVIGFASILFVAIGAGASGALNMWWDADIDAVMRRTSKRPIPAGRVGPGEALGLGVALSGLSVMMLAVTANLMAAALLAFTIFFYAVVYSMWLKRSTPQNIVIGGAAGAFPPVIGWVIATGSFSIEAWLMFALIFMWTPPHFWALAIHRKEEYAAVDIPMLPVTHGVAFTKLHILLYTVIMFLITLLPFATKLSGPLYLLGAVVLGGGFLYWAIELMRGRNPNAAMETFKYSIVYLMALFVVMLVDHYLFPTATL